MPDPADTQLHVDMGIVKSQVADQGKKLDRIEKKLDAISFVSKEEFEVYKKEVREIYVTKDENRPLKTLFWSIISALVVGVVGLVVGLLGLK